MNVTISLGQMDCKLGDPALNFAHAETLVEEAARRGSDFLLLPELWSTAYDLGRAWLNWHRHWSNRPMMPTPPPIGLRACSRAGAEAWHLAGWLNAGIARRSLLQFAGGLHAAGHAGGGLSQDPSLSLDARGISFSPLGPATATVEMPWGEAGLAICYDLRFPELFRAYALAGAR